MKIGIEVTNEDLDDIIIAAVEGGTYGLGYWAMGKTYRWGEDQPDGASIMIKEREDEGSPVKPGWHKVDRALVLRGLEVCAAKYPHIFADFIKSGSPGDYAPDASCSEVIVQCGLFGESVYG